QFRVAKENVDDAFYELQNTLEKIQAYVFNVVRANVPKMAMDELFEEKGDVSKVVLDEIEKILICERKRMRLMQPNGYNLQ
ncbi:hypothetical protein KI387_031201, partial [Taxus chinensis]